MIVDTSVLLHILYREPGARGSVEFLAGQSDLLIAAPTLLEAEIVFGSKRGFHRNDVAELSERLGIAVIPFARDHAREARLAYSLFGKGQGHPARLNFGDCISYALAKVEDLPLIYTGDDFLHTDLDLVRLPFP